MAFEYKIIILTVSEIVEKATTMSSENSEVEKTKRRFEAKVLRKRFLFRTAERQDRRFETKIDQSLATPTPVTQNSSSENEGKVDKRLDDAALERFVAFVTTTFTIIMFFLVKTGWQLKSC